MATWSLLRPPCVCSWHFGAETMCEYSQKEFEEGMASLNCDSLEKLKAKLPSLRAELQVRRAWGVGPRSRHGEYAAPCRARCSCGVQQKRCPTG